MRYICVNCNYLYDESVWDEAEWIKSWTTVDSMWNNWVCPSCESSTEDFQQITEEIMYLENKDLMTSLEALHFPNAVFIWEDKIKVFIWNIEHPMEQEHFISSVMLYDEYEDLIEEKFLTYNEKPIVEFDVEWIDEFEIRTRCNIHWLWSTWIIENSET